MAYPPPPPTHTHHPPPSHPSLCYSGQKVPNEIDGSNDLRAIEFVFIFIFVFFERKKSLNLLFIFLQSYDAKDKFSKKSNLTKCLQNCFRFDSNRPYCLLYCLQYSVHYIHIWTRPCVGHITGFLYFNISSGCCVMCRCKMGN